MASLFPLFSTRTGSTGRLVLFGEAALSQVQLHVEDTLIPYDGGLVLRVNVRGSKGEHVSEEQFRDLSSMVIKGQVHKGEVLHSRSCGPI